MNKTKRKKIHRHNCTSSTKQQQHRHRIRLFIYTFDFNWNVCTWCARFLHSAVYALHCEFLKNCLLRFFLPRIGLCTIQFIMHINTLRHRHKQSQHRSSLAHSNNRHRIERNYNGHNVYFVVHFPRATCISSSPSRERENESVSKFMRSKVQNANDCRR